MITRENGIRSHNTGIAWYENHKKYNVINQAEIKGSKYLLPGWGATQFLFLVGTMEDNKAWNNWYYIMLHGLYNFTE